MAAASLDNESSQSSSGYEDGLGRRTLGFDRETGGMLERLLLRPELCVFEQALERRLAIVAALEDERFARPREIQHADDRLIVVSEYLAGRRLCDLVDAAAEHGIIAGLDAGLGLLLELLPAIARLHEAGLSHGAIAPGRVMVTPAGQIVLLDAIYAEPLERLHLTRKRLWSQFRLAFPPSAGSPRFDKAADVAHASMIAATLTVGRAPGDDDYPQGIPVLRQEILEIASIRGSRSFADAVDRFFAATLPLAGRRTSPTADEAAIDLRKLVRKELGINTCRAALLDFFQQVEVADTERAAAEAAALEERAAAAAEIRDEAVKAERVKAERAERERSEQARLAAERLKAERRELERLEAERAEQERVEQARIETERREQERAEKARLKAEKAEAKRRDAERLDAERLEARRVEQERIAAEKLEAERRERERQDAERIERERIERERIEEARVETERRERERAEKARLKAEKLEAERREAERLEAERLEAERAEKARIAAEKLEAERRERERREAERIERERAETARLEAERLAAERLEQERREQARVAAEKADAERRERERLDAERIERARVEHARLEAERREAERLEAERLEHERAERARIEAERLEAEGRERERLEALRIERERAEEARLAAERREAERLEAERVERERVEQARLEADRLEAERRDRERREAERVEHERAERARVEAERRERERAEAERRERERVQQARIEEQRLERERRDAERAAEKARRKAERLEEERLEAAREAERAKLDAERLERQRADAAQRERERVDAERRERDRIERQNAEADRRAAEAPAAASMNARDPHDTPDAPAGNWLVRPDRAALFDPVPEPPAPAPAVRPYPIYVAPAEPAAWAPNEAPAAPRPPEIVPIAAAPPAVYRPAPPPAAPSRSGPIRLKLDDRDALPSYTVRRQRIAEAPSTPGDYEPFDIPQSGTRVPWKWIAAGVMLIAGALAVGRGLMPSASPVVDTVRKAIPVPVPAAVAPVDASVGRLTITTQPPGAKVLVDGVPAGESPVTIERLKPGRHVITLTGPDGAARRTVRVVAGQAVTIDVPLFSGFAAISVPFLVDVAEKGKLLGTSENQILLSPGAHDLRLSNKDLGYTENRTVDIQAGEVTRLELDPRGRANINAAPWAEVWIDGEKAGETPLANVPIRLGVREIVFKNPQFPDRRQTVTVTAGAPAAISIDFVK